MISVILPTYERPDSVLCALAALDIQTLPAGQFEVILVDDSATDAVKERVYFNNGDVRYIRSSPPRTGSFTAGRARNIGAANARYDLLIFIDQDVMLAPDCLERYAEAYRRHGDGVVYLGLYHWLPRMDFAPYDVRTRYDEILATGMHYLSEDADLAFEPSFEPLTMQPAGTLGWDMRGKDFSDDVDHLVDDAALGCFSGNIGYAKKLYIDLGGFDEKIDGHGGEDADLGLTAKEHGAKFLLWDKIWGMHRWHSRNQAQNEKEVQQNIAYIDRKHGIGQYADAKKWMDARNWSSEEHYTKQAGGVAMQVEGEPTIWVCRDGHKVGVATPAAFVRLGFGPEDVMIVPPSALSSYQLEGVVK